MRTSFLSVICSAVAALSLSVSAGAAQDAVVSLELNNASPTEAGGCRLIYVAVNQSDTGLSQVGYQFGVFDAGGVVSPAQRWSPHPMSRASARMTTNE